MTQEKVNEKISQELNKQGVAEPEETRPLHGIDWTAIIEGIVEHDRPVKIPEPFTEPWLNNLLNAAIDYACQAQSSERDQRQVRQLQQQLKNAKHSHQIEIEELKAAKEVNSYASMSKQLEQAREGNGKLREQIRELEQKLRLSEGCERATETRHSEAIKRIDELRKGMTEVQNFWRNAQWAKERAERENTHRKEVIQVALEGLGTISRWGGAQTGWRDHAAKTLETITQKLRLIEGDRMAPEQKEPKTDQDGSQRHAPWVEISPGSYRQQPEVEDEKIFLELVNLKTETYRGPHASLAKALQRLEDQNTTRDSSPGYLINKMIEALRDLRYAYGAGPLWDLIEEEAETICGTAALMADQAHEQTGGKNK